MGPLFGSSLRYYLSFFVLKLLQDTPHGHVVMSRRFPVGNFVLFFTKSKIDYVEKIFYLVWSHS